MNNFFVIGNPINHSKSPMLFKYIFDTLNIKGIYSSKLISNQHTLKSFIHHCKQIKVKGINITMPLKEDSIPYTDIIDPIAKITKSINCLHFIDDKIIGYNNDYYGFSQLIKLNHLNLEHTNNIIIGSGGSTRTIILYLIKQKVKNIYLLSRNKKTTLQIIKDFTGHLEQSNLNRIDNNSDLKNCNLINCTPIGLSENTNIEILSNVPKIHYRTIIDINYHITTNYLNFASDKTIDGKSMFIFQALKSLDIWFESNISNKLDYQHLEQLLC